MDAATALRSRLQGMGGAPQGVPSLEMVNFLEQAAAAPAHAPTSSKAPAPAPPAAPAPAPPSEAAPKPAPEAPWRASAPWHKPPSKDTAGKPTTFSKAAPPKAPGAPGGSESEDLAQAISNHLQGATGTPSVEIIQALARAAKLEEGDEKKEKDEEKDGKETEEADAGASGKEEKESAPSADADQREDELPKVPRSVLEQLSKDAMAAAMAGEVGSNPKEAAEAAAKAAIELMAKQLRQHADSGLVPAGDRWTEDAEQEEKGSSGVHEGSGPPPPGKDTKDTERPSLVEPVTAAARAVAGPTSGVFRYDFASADADVEACFRNIRRRVEVEMGDGCTVQMTLQMVR